MAKKLSMIAGLFAGIMLATSLSTGVLAADNLVVNGNFKKGDGASSIVGWQEWNFAGGGSVKHVLDGKGAPYVTITSDENNGEGSDHRIFQTIHGEFNTTYKVTGQIRAEGIKKKDKTGAIISIPYEVDATDSLYNTHGKWKKVTMYIQTTDTKKDFDLSLSVGGHSSQNYGTASFKNITVEKFDDAVPGNANICKFKNTGRSDNGQGGGQSGSQGSKSNVWLIVIAIVIVCAIGIYFLLFTGKKPTGGDDGDGSDDDDNDGDDDEEGINDINDAEEVFEDEAEDSVDDVEETVSLDDEE